MSLLDLLQDKYLQCELFGADYDHCLQMMSSNYFQIFSDALDAKREEIKYLHDRIAKLEIMNSEVLDFVHKTGRLPEVQNSVEYPIKNSSQDDRVTDLTFCTAQRDDHQRLETPSSKSVDSSVLLGVISKQTEELSRTLKSLGLESGQRNQILCQVQENLTNVFTSHLKSTDTVIQNRRRRELHRTNQRIGLMSAYSVAHSTGSCTSLICHSTSPSLHFPSISQETVVLDDYSHCSDLNTVKMSSIGVSLAGSMSHLCGSEKSDITPISAMKVCPIMCPCGNRQTCPLSERKVACLLEDSRVSRGFTLLSAIFRGRLTRQLLATHKVCDLIRTVKDTAKLALSLHLERQSSIQGIVSGPQALSSDEPVELSDQELILESRLLAQIQGTLNQIHEIFFTWPVSEKLSLLSASRSVSKKFKRPISGAENMETSNFSISSHSFTNNSTSKSSSQVSPSTSRVLRQLQPHQVNSPYKASQINKDGEKKRDVCIIRIESTDAQYKPNILPCRTNNQIPKSRKQQIQNENKPCTENNLRIGKSTVIQGNCRYNECKNNSKAYSQVSGAFTQSNVIDSQFRLEKKNKTSFHSFRSFRKLSGQSDHLSDSPVSQARTLSLRAVSVTCASKMSGSYKPANIGINASSLVRGGLKQGINKHSSKKTPEYELKPRIDNSPTPSRNEPSDKNSQSNMFTSERETNLKESKNVATSQINDFNTFSSSGTSNSNNFNNYLETSGKEKLSISFKQQANGPTCSTLSQCNAFSKKKALQSPLTDNDSPKKVYYPVKRRIISRQPRSESKTIVIQQPTDQDALTVETNHNCSNFQWFFLGEQQYSKDIYQNNKYNEISSSDQLFVQQNQPINDESTLRSTTRSTNTDNSLGNIGITNYCENSNASNHISKLRTTWTLDNPLLPSPTSEC